MALVTAHDYGRLPGIGSQPLRPVADANHDCYLPMWQNSHSVYTEQKRRTNFGAGALKKRPPRADVVLSLTTRYLTHMHRRSVI